MSSDARHILFVEASTSGAGERAADVAIRAGHFVTLITRNAAVYPQTLLRHVHETVSCNTNDSTDLLRAAGEVYRRHPIHGITTTADFYVPQAALLAELFSLPGLNYKSAMSARNKHTMRTVLRQYRPHLNPAYRLALTYSQAVSFIEECGFPIIAKPQDANDSTFVRLIESFEALNHYMASAATWGSNSAGQPLATGVLLEQFVEGEEYSVETAQEKGGSLQLIGVTVKHLGTGRARFVEMGHSFPGHHEKELFSATAEALDALGIDCGVIHTECKIGPDGVKIIEVNPRMAGGRIGSHVIELATGSSPSQLLIDIALGKPARWNPEELGGAAISFRCCEHGGKFGGISNEAAVRSLPGVRDVFICIPEGASVRSPDSNSDRIAAVLAEGGSRHVAMDRAQAACAQIELLIE